MELPNIKETASSMSGYPIKNYVLKLHETSSSEYHTRHIDKDFLPKIVSASVPTNQRGRSKIRPYIELCVKKDILINRFECTCTKKCVIIKEK